jgi:glycylpeptide N-tetradecanoyltransferase
MIKRNKLPDQTQTAGLRMMEDKDVKAVTKLLRDYLEGFDLVPVYSEEEVRHWFLPKGDEAKRVIWTYVVEVFPFPTILTIGRI